MERALMLANVLDFLLVVVGIVLFAIYLSRKAGEVRISLKKKLFGVVGAMVILSAILLAAAS